MTRRGKIIWNSTAAAYALAVIICAALGIYARLEVMALALAFAIALWRVK
jgi:hypothetical protein